MPQARQYTAVPISKYTLLHRRYLSEISSRLGGSAKWREERFKEKRIADERVGS